METIDGLADIPIVEEDAAVMCASCANPDGRIVEMSEGGDRAVTLDKTRSQSYRVARDLGNLQAALKGPSSYSKRYVRRAVLRKTNRTTYRVLRSFKL